MNHVQSVYISDIHLLAMIYVLHNIVHVLGILSCLMSSPQYGDTFILHLFGAKLFCVFSSPGLRALYSVRENDASFTEATKGLLGLKLPVGGSAMVSE